MYVGRYYAHLYSSIMIRVENEIYKLFKFLVYSTVVCRMSYVVKIPNCLTFENELKLTYAFLFAIWFRNEP
jgi:hypothetical protein